MQLLKLLFCTHHIYFAYYFLSRAYCNECLEFYCEPKGLEKILDDKAWKCFACLYTTTLKTTIKLIPRKPSDQLKNVIIKVFLILFYQKS